MTVHPDEWYGMDLSLEVVELDAGAGRVVVGLTSQQASRTAGALLELADEVPVPDFPAVVGVVWETVGALRWELGRAWTNLPREHQSP